jgi:hypothetical protein
MKYSISNQLGMFELPPTGLKILVHRVGDIYQSIDYFGIARAQDSYLGRLEALPYLF